MASLVDMIDIKQVYFRNRIFRKEELIDAIGKLSLFLDKNLISTSPFILLPAYNHIKTFIAYFAILKSKKIAVIIDPSLKSIELSEILKDIDPSSIILINSDTIKWDYEEEVIFRKVNNDFVIHSDLKDVCTVAYTNAEDGFSKGAMLTEKNILSEIDALIETEKIHRDSVVCSFLPFSHLYGLLQGLLAPSQSGGSSVILDVNLLKINDVVKDFNRYKITHLFTVPSVYYLLSKVDNVRQYFSNIEYFYSGGTKLSKLIYDKFYEKTNLKIREGYGLTECSPACALNYQEGDPNIESIGLPFPNCEIKILDENDNECDLNTVGEICIKGDLVFKGYFNNDNTTSMVLKNGWLHTGDYGKKDRNGFIYFCGLKKNMVNVAGNNVYPKELERLLKLNKDVNNVQVTSQDSILQGSTIVADIELKSNSPELIKSFKEWCNKNITNYKLPKIWNINQQ